MTHMSFHGALGNMAAADAALAAPLVRAVAAFDPELIIISSSSHAIEAAAAACGLRVATTFLADRAYGDDGLLVPRGQAGSVIHDEAVVLARVRRLLRDGVVITATRQSAAHAGALDPAARRHARRGRVRPDDPRAIEACRREGRAGLADHGGRRQARRIISEPYLSTVNPSWR